ncbi:hypothetical protein [Paracoccus sp. ME4]|uniref:hypothetical protein n=1 Tax=Paracoccus sp. ME4 TaxID=3138066 RepID=UPI00398BBC5B
MKNPDDAYEGEWDFHGSCAPEEGKTFGNYAGQATFTLGCFRWTRRGRDGAGKGLKKGKVVYRVRGDVADSAQVYQAARDYCARMNAAQKKIDAGTLGKREGAA